MTDQPPPGPFPPGPPQPPEPGSPPPGFPPSGPPPSDPPQSGPPQSGPPEPGFPPSGTPGWGQPAPKSNRTRNIVLIVVGVVLAICCLCAVGGAFFLKDSAESLGPANAAAVAFIEDLQEGDASGAYDRLCDETRSKYSREQFASGLSGRPKITDYDIVGVHAMNYNGRSSATVTAKLTDTNGFSDSHMFQLVEEDGEWKVCGDPY